MSKQIAGLMLTFVPVFIVLIVTAMQDLLANKTGYTFDSKEMEIPVPAITICPYSWNDTPDRDQAFRALNYNNANTLPLDLSMTWAPDYIR